MARRNKKVDLEIRVCEAAEWIPLGSLHGMSENPRKPLNKAQRASLLKSLQKLGLFRPLLVWRDETGVERVIGGNQKLRELKELAINEPVRFVRTGGEEAPGIPITRYEGSPESAKLVAVRDNNNEGEWDYSLLGRQLAEIADAEIDLDLTGFDEGLLKDMADYGKSAEVRLMEAASHDPVEGKPAPPPAPDPNGPTEPGDQLVGVKIGFVRGRIRKETYDRFLIELAPNDLEREQGVDRAFCKLLDRLKS